MDPWELVLTHRYDEALAQYDARFRADPEAIDALDMSNRSTALLCLGRLPEALAGFQQANELAAERLRGETQPYLAKIGGILWLLNRQDDAIQTWTQAVDGILDGSIKFADEAGGVSQGLLLWYGGVTANHHAAIKQSLAYLRKLARKTRITNWPGPLALFALEQNSEQDLLLEISGASDLETAVNRSRDDLLKRRSLAKTLFYFATRQRARGSEDECRALMRQCAAFENPILEIEWYLARAEVALHS